MMQNIMLLRHCGRFVGGLSDKPALCICSGLAVPRPRHLDWLKLFKTQMMLL